MSIVSIVVDNESWILPFAQDLVNQAVAGGHQAKLIRAHKDVLSGDVAFYLGCTQITPPDIIARNTRNLVVHESDLPKGRGFAPMTWQILEGVSEIPVCLIEAEEEADAGAIVYRDVIILEGHELNKEWRHLQGKKTIELCLRFLNDNFRPQGEPQKGVPTVYKRRQPEDSALDPEKTIAEQFELLRVVDNERYPAYFEYRGQRYKLTVEKDNA
jgi:methionyl-tRNA formyltransferase